MDDPDPDPDPDPWVARDKLYHFLFCLLLTFLFSAAARLSPSPFLRRRSVLFGSIASLLAGAAKEAADHLRIFPSSGASARDAVADLLGVLVAASLLSIFGPRVSRPDSDSEPRPARIHSSIV
ncbi:hypothetical protein MLD38_031586 [Melastoma candidum]|uniref:Uncharacterized protein n=1 Tax=Melastoma candidum TaxID=119954 RepID=A0ACB9MUV9_9MYRT|nr:hypothetical protein MLD38_031586 [Melastoma candidum]